MICMRRFFHGARKALGPELGAARDDKLLKLHLKISLSSRAAPSAGPSACGETLSLQHPLQIIPSMRLLMLRDFFRCTHRNNLAALVATLRTQINNPIRCFNHI
jgi:hypothetical protein